MVTYPSTHGVYEDTITELCELVHDAGGQVYVDGANLNALVGLAQPGKFGADVSHLNLHKTFCIPHGGGGPGVGPVAVRAHLAPHLPNHPLAPEAGPESGVGPVSRGALRLGEHPADLVGVRPPHGRRRSAPRHPDGRARRELHRRPAARALPGALLRARRPRRARVHPRRPADHGRDRRDGRRHRQAPRRLRLPRADDELPRRRHAHGRADRVGEPARARPLLRRDDRDPRRDRGDPRGRGRRRPTACCATRRTRPCNIAGEWDHPYDRTEAAFPVGVDAADKYWPPVSRIDGAYGDRNLVCSCPPPEAFEG